MRAKHDGHRWSGQVVLFARDFVFPARELFQTRRSNRVERFHVERRACWCVVFVKKVAAKTMQDERYDTKERVERVFLSGSVRIRRFGESSNGDALLRSIDEEDVVVLKTYRRSVPIVGGSSFGASLSTRVRA